MTIKQTIERDGAEIEVEAEFKYWPACKGSRDSLCGVRGAGPPLEPDEQAELEFIAARIGNIEVELTTKEIHQARDAAWQKRIEI